MAPASHMIILKAFNIEKYAFPSFDEIWIIPNLNMVSEQALSNFTLISIS